MPGERKLTPALAMAGLAIVLCALLALLTDYAKVQIKQSDAKPAAAAPGRFDARIKSLSKEAYFTTQRDGLDNYDIPGTGKWVRHSEPGLYIDVVSDKVLFSSTAKLESIDGFAEFSAPASPEEIEEVQMDSPVVKIRSRTAGTWLGRIAADRANPGAKRYLVNSTALNFVPATELETLGLGEWRRLFPAGPGLNQ